MTAPEPLRLTLEEAMKHLAPLPDDARMNAYYYGFDRTGVGAIDAILSAVAVAGKVSHHTSYWTEESDGYYRDRPGLPDAANAVELIQGAANRAAAVVRALVVERDPCQELRDAARKLLREWREWAAHNQSNLYYGLDDEQYEGFGALVSATERALVYLAGMEEA